MGNHFLCPLHGLQCGFLCYGVSVSPKISKTIGKIKFADQMLLCHEIPVLCSSFLLLNIAEDAGEIIISAAWITIFGGEVDQHGTSCSIFVGIRNVMNKQYLPPCVELSDCTLTRPDESWLANYSTVG